MNKIKIEDIVNTRIAVNCKTKEEAEKFLNVLNKLGAEWLSHAPLTETNFERLWDMTCYELTNIKKLSYADKDYFKSKNIETISFDEVDLNCSVSKNTRYTSTLQNFSTHKWVRFYENEEGEPNIQWAEGCHDVGIDGLDSFEKRVLDKYGEDKNNIIYRTYMLESDKLRLALNLPTSRLETFK